MKLAFSTNGWSGCSWNDFLGFASGMGFDGIELHKVDDGVLKGPGGPLDPTRTASTVREMIELGLELPCLDALCDLSDASAEEENLREVLYCIEMASAIKIPYVRIHASAPEGGENADEAVKRCISALLPEAEKLKVTLLMETCGIYADTGRLRDVLNYFASDSLAALWDMHHPFRRFGEDPEQTVSNLGAWIKHVHIKDSVTADGRTEFRLMGEGDLPVSDMFAALRSIGYDGFITLELDPAAVEELGVPDIVFPHFVSVMRRFERGSRRSLLYSNRAGTGKYIWKKDALIEQTFPQVLDRMVEEFPDQYAFKYTTLDYTRTYSQFRDDVDEFARALIALGVKPGGKVAVWATNVPQWFISFWAVTKIGAVLVSMNTAYKIHEAEYLLRQSDTHTLVMVSGFRDSDYRAIMRELCPELDNTPSGSALHSRRLPFLRNIITVGFRMDGCMTWDEAVSRSVLVPVAELRRRAAAVDIHDVCNMQYTSGTTGFPKGVMLTHYNVVNDGKCIGDRMDLSTADRMMIQVPMFHCFGMVLAMTASMTHGTSLFPLPYFSAKPALACINNERITCFHGVPTMFIAMLEHEDFPKTDFSYMRTGIMAGSPCPISVMQDVVDKMNMTEITIVYGQTEASPGCTMSSTDDPLEVRVGTVGRAMPEIECRIVDPETGEDLPDNVTGEFIARGYNIMKGYYKMPRATAAAIDADGWLHTGDLACRTPEGNYRITGRLKDMIIRGGENIYPKEIEEFIYTHPKVSDVQVIGVPDEALGEEIMACVILKSGETMTEDELKAFVRDHMARHKVPKYVRFMDSFPMNVAGKILKYKMREDAIELLGLKKAAEIVTA
ncbi:MAG: AMP-binding protein [Oscillospiraceae bacterium]|nr:AMP-binding protein [Oscillospiraceae bacterium]